MAVTDQQKLDFLLKKIGYTKTKTGSVVGTGAISGTPKQPFAEAIPSPLIIANGALWNEADSIPATPPGADTTQVKVYLAATSGLRMTADATSSGQRAYIAYSTYGNTSSTRLTNWIDTQFGASYIIKVYRGDPNSGGVNLSAAGSGANDGWFFDYSAGVLNFNDTNVPSGVTDTNIYIVGYRYIGQTGAPTSGISTFSYLDLAVERNLEVGIQGGISTFHNNIDLNADLDVDGHTNLDNVSVTGFTTFFATGGTKFFTNIDADNGMDVTGLSTFASAVDINSDLDVDGHTNLDNVSIAGVTTFADDVKLKFGNGGDLEIFHRSADNNSIIKESGSGVLSLETNGVNISFYDTANNVAMAKFFTGGSCYFNFGATTRLETTNTGINVIGNVVSDGLVVDGNSDLNGDLDVDGHTNLDNVSVAGVSTFTGDATFSGNVSIGGTLTYEDVTNVDSVGLLTARSGIRVTGGVIEALAGENKIPSLYAAMGNLPSAGSYHGMFAHVHATGRGYFAHAGNWLELVNREINGVVGTGTETYNIGNLVSTSSTATSLNVTGVTTAVTLDVNGDLDVDGHTNLDNVSIAGFTTITQDLNVDGHTNLDNVSIAGFTTITQDLDVDGHTNLDNVNIAGVTTIGSYLKLRSFATGGSPQFTAAEFRVLKIDGSTGGPMIQLMQNGADREEIQFFTTLFAAEFQKDGRLLLNKNFQVTGVSTFTGAIDANGDLDVDGHTNLDNVSIAGFTTITQDLDVDGHTNLDNVSIAGVSTFAGAIDLNADLDVDGHTNLDNVNIAGVTTIATSRLLIGTNVEGYAGAPNLTIADTGNCGVTIRSGASNQGTIAFSDAESGAGEYDGFLQYSQADRELKVGTASAVRFTVNSSGHVVPYVDSTYDLGSSTKRWRNLHADNIVSAPGNGFIGPDLTVRNFKATGISTFTGAIDANGDLDVDGHTNLDNVSVAGVTTFTGTAEFDGTAKFDSTITAGGATGTNGQYLKTTGTGVEWATFPTLRTRQTFTASAGQTTFSFTYTVNFIDVFVNGIKLTDAEFTATNGSSVVLAVGCFVGDIVELVSYNTVSAGGGASGINNVVEDTTPQLGGNLDLFNKSITGTGNINITGIISATTFKGPSGVTATFVGDGSGLTGITASGSGVVIKDSNNTVGTAGTINFGDNLSVSPASAGIVTVTAGVTTSQFNVNKLDVSGISTFKGNIDVNADLDVDGHTNLDNVSVAGVSTFSDNVRIVDNKSLLIGNLSNGDLSFVHDGNNSVIRNRTGDLYIANASSTGVFLGGTNGEVRMYYGGSQKFETENEGVKITGRLRTTGDLDVSQDLDVDGHTNLDNVSIAGVVTATTLKGAIQGTSGTFSSGVDVTGDLDVDGHTDLDNVSVAGVVTATTFVGALTGNVTGNVSGSSGSTTGNAATATALQNARTIGGVSFDGTANINLPGVNSAGNQNTSGNAATATLATDATSFTVSANNSTNETVYPVFVDGATGSQGAETDTGLTYNPSTGNLTSTKFTGDGSGLTGITASGSGVVIKHDGSTVGTAGTINFGTNLDVSAISGGAVTITASGGSGSGISTISGVVNIVNDLDVDGHTNLDNVSVAGVTTVQSFHATTGAFSDTISITDNIQHTGDTNTQIRFPAADTISFETSGSESFRINASGHVVPGTDSTYDLGLTGTRWRNVYADTLYGDGSNLTGVNANVGITTNLSGTFTASAGSPSTINTFGYGSGDIVVEYTVFIKNGSDFQSQKLLAMRDGTTIHSTQFAVMYSSSLLVQLDATISSGNILLRATPETGVSGSTTYKVKREVM